MGQVVDFLTKFSSIALDAVYPPKCALCGLLGDREVCGACLANFKRAGAEPSLSRHEGPLAFRSVLYRYEGRAAQAVRLLKYARSTSLVRFMAAEIAEERVRLGLQEYEVVPVPIHWSRRCRRGFNQAELLCEISGWTPEILNRVRRTRPQVGLTRDERARNLENAFRASPLATGRSILLVDDVLTSGQTARECAKALCTAGAKEVGILAFCGEV